MSRPYCSIPLFSMTENCSGVLAMTVIASSSILACTSGSLSDATSSSCRRAVVAGGSPAGPNRPNQDAGFSKPGSASPIEGTSGSPG